MKQIRQKNRYNNNILTVIFLKDFSVETLIFPSIFCSFNNSSQLSTISSIALLTPQILRDPNIIPVSTDGQDMELDM